MLQLTEEQFTKDLLLNAVTKEDLYRLGLRFVISCHHQASHSWGNSFLTASFTSLFRTG